MGASACDDVWEWIEAWVTDWDSDGEVAVLLEKFNQGSFAVEASLAPTP